MVAWSKSTYAVQVVSWGVWGHAPENFAKVEITSEGLKPYYVQQVLANEKNGTFATVHSFVFNCLLRGFWALI